MSGALPGLGAGDYGLLSSLVTDSDVVKTRLEQLQRQVATGYVAPTLGGLGGASAKQVLDLRPQIAEEAQYQANIGAAQGRLSTTQSALSSLSAIASRFYADLPKLSSLTPTEVDSVAQQAKQALSQVASLINTKDGDTYVFAGQSPDAAPIADPSAASPTSAFSTFLNSVSAAVSGLGTNGAASTIAATFAASSPFDASLSNAVPTIQTGQGQFVQVGVLATRNTLAPTTGPSTTGSSMHDILVSLATIASLNSGEAGTPGFADLVTGLTKNLSGAMNSLNNEAGALGDIQRNLSSRNDEIGTVRDALKAQLSSATDVDMASTISALTQVQTQLRASYQVIATAKDMSLSDYL